MNKSKIKSVIETKSKTGDKDKPVDSLPKQSDNKKSNIEEKPSEEKDTEIDKKKSKVSKTEESPKKDTDMERAKEVTVKDPLKDEKRMKCLKRCTSHLCLLVLVLAVNNIILGLFAHYFYSNKTHLVLFGCLCIMQLIGAPMGWMAIKYGNRLMFLCCSIINLIWIISVVILLIYYWLINRSASFNQEIALHVGAFFFMAAALALGFFSFLMMQQLEMINIQYKKPEFIITPEGKPARTKEATK